MKYEKILWKMWVRKIARFGVALLLVAISVYACSITPVRKLWAKRPGSESRLFAFERNGRVGFVDQTGKIIIQPTIVASIEDVGDFSNGLARVDHQGYIDEAGRWIIKKDLWWGYDFSDGLALALVDDPSQKYEKTGIVLDLLGRVVATVPAFRTSEFSEGLAAYEAEGKTSVRRFEPQNFIYRDYPGLKGFLDRLGNIVIKPEFADVGPFRSGLARAVLDGYCHIASWDGGRQGTPTTGYPTSCGGAPADAVSPCKVGFINPKGQFTIQPRFEGAQDFQEEFAAVRSSGRWGFVDMRGAVVVPPRFEQVKSFREGLAAVKTDGRWGFIDGTGRFAIEPQFEEVEPFSDSLAVAYKNGRSFYIDRDGHTKIRGPFREATPFVNGLAAVLRTEKHVAYIDHSGQTVFEYFRH